MKKNHPYTEYYKILNAKPDHSWKELRKVYKTQIQKWHPDRFKEGSTKKDAAEHKIKDINAAFQQLSQYYKKHGFLPVIENAAAEPKPAPEIKRPQTTNKKAKNFKAPDTKNNKRPFLLSLIIITIFIYAFIELTPEEATLSNTKQSEITTNTIARPLSTDKTTKSDNFTHNDLNRLDEGKIHEEIVNHENTFTYGASISDIIAIQGTPTKIEGDSWFYGESVVYFHEGTVIKWKRVLGHPLKASLIAPNQKN